MQNLTEIFKSIFNYYQRVAHVKLYRKVSFWISYFRLVGLFGTMYDFTQNTKNAHQLVELTKIRISFKHEK
jgi:hypothetical protein